MKTLKKVKKKRDENVNDWRNFKMSIGYVIILSMKI